MSLSIAKKAVDFLFDSDLNDGVWINPKQSDGIILNFVGGEPLLEINLIDSIMDYFLEKAISLNHRWSLKYMIGMSSNGMLYNTEPVLRFMRKWEGRISINITVDGNKKLHDACRVDFKGNGSYDVASKAFESAIKHSNTPSTKFTIAPGNVQYVFEATKEMIETFDIFCVMSNCVYEEGWTLEHATTLYYELKKLSDWVISEYPDTCFMFSIFDSFIGKPLSNDSNWCGGTGKMLAIDVDGSLLPSLRYSSLSLGLNQPPLVIGDIINGIASTQEQKSMIEMLESITLSSQSTQECIDCPIASGCAWCSAYNYEMTGTPNKRVIYACVMHKARVLATSYYWNILFRHHKDESRFELNIPKEWALEIISEEEYSMLLDLSI